MHQWHLGCISMHLFGLTEFVFKRIMTLKSLILITVKR